MVNEKPRLINPTIVPYPANGTPDTIQVIDKIDTPKNEIKLNINPRVEIHINGVALYAKILLEAIVMTLKSDTPNHLDSPENLGGLLISISIVLNPTQAPKPLRNR